MKFYTITKQEDLKQFEKEEYYEVLGHLEVECHLKLSKKLIVFGVIKSNSDIEIDGGIECNDILIEGNLILNDVKNEDVISRGFIRSMYNISVGGYIKSYYIHAIGEIKAESILKH